MAEPARKIYERDDHVDARLRELGPGLTRDLFKKSILFAEAERRTCTADDPRILKGVLPWGRCVRSLREELRPFKWPRQEPNGLPLVVSPDGKVAITVETGDENTGNSEAKEVFTKHEKGPILRDWVNPPEPQISMEDQDPEHPAAELPDLWILLVARMENEIRAELSRPSSVTEDKRLRYAGERIILRPLALDPTIPTDDSDDEAEPDIDVPVERL